jgi:inner membrane protein
MLADAAASDNSDRDSGIDQGHRTTGMDNICHTLVGAAMAEAGLKRQSAYARATLMIAANIPDLDVLVFATATPSVSFRRGWTHGVVAQALLPVALTLAMLAWARWRRSRGLRLVEGSPPVRAGALLALSYLALYSHLFLDFLNNYGVRLLAPVEWRWFYGDAVFIIDPWLWVTLGAGVWLSSRRRPAHGNPPFYFRPARVALAVATGYVAFMLGSAEVARAAVGREWRARHGTEPAALMVGPIPVWPFAREVIIDAGDHYETGTYRFWSPYLQLDAPPIPKNDRAPEVAAARTAPRVRALLVWSRFPYWVVERDGDGAIVTLADVRFRARQGTFVASARVP